MVWAMVLQTFSKNVQAFIEALRVVPERCVPRIRHQLNLRVRHRRLVLIDGGGFDNRIRDTMLNQHWPADLWQEVVIIEGAREQSLTDIRWDGDVISQHEIQLGGGESVGKTPP